MHHEVAWQVCLLAYRFALRVCSKTKRRRPLRGHDQPRPRSIFSLISAGTRILSQSLRTAAYEQPQVEQVHYVFELRFPGEVLATSGKTLDLILEWGPPYFGRTLRDHELKIDISDRCQDPVHIVSLERRLPVKPGTSLSWCVGVPNREHKPSTIRAFHSTSRMNVQNYRLFLNGINDILLPPVLQRSRFQKTSLFYSPS